MDSYQIDTGTFNPRQKIGIMGGTFNPIHNGHLLIAENALCQYRLDRIYFIPTGLSPHKGEQEIIPANIRYEMIERAIYGNPGFAASSIEIDSTETSYTYLTLEKLTTLYPDNRFYFIMGGDSLRDFSGWRNPKRICELCHLLAAVRNNMDMDMLCHYADAIKQQFHGSIDLLNTPNFSVSSHEIRERVRNHDSIRYLVPEEVRIYIEENQLYQ